MIFDNLRQTRIWRFWIAAAWCLLLKIFSFCSVIKFLGIKFFFVYFWILDQSHFFWISYAQKCWKSDFKYPIHPKKIWLWKKTSFFNALFEKFRYNQYSFELYSICNKRNNKKKCMIVKGTTENQKSENHLTFLPKFYPKETIYT